MEYYPYINQGDLPAMARDNSVLIMINSLNTAYFSFLGIYLAAGLSMSMTSGPLTHFNKVPSGLSFCTCSQAEIH